MVQLAHVSSFGSNASAQKPFDTSLAELGRLLQRLQQSTLHSDPVRERRLRTSEYERAKLKSNLDYARRALTSLEQDALAIKAPVRRAEVQSDLNHKREVLDLLFERLEDLKQVAIDDDEDSSEGEDLFGDLALTAHSASEPESQSPAPAHQVPEALPSETQAAAVEVTPAASQPETTRAPSPSSQPNFEAQPTHTAQSIRSRTSAPSPPPDYSTSRAALFASRRKAASPLASAPATSTATAQALLDRQREEQEALTDSMLDLAKRLKANTASIHSDLEADKELVDKAGEGLDKTERTMESATGRMGVLKKMTEGVGWWGRMMLWARIGVMVVVILLIMFVMPKLRF
ncbi:hypothetical protein NLU13_6060 [Sarocladium strictum]|uniref:Synaptobrevin n=1 Tax=Sarocladium strictum TaxID=5046 RepID=A0AA39L6R7_SARSR|nr:hypothetical protein NLU13_6060 [Sarocladium strictum]